jgi:hypothetical protein
MHALWRYLDWTVSGATSRKADRTVKNILAHIVNDAW